MKSGRLLILGSSATIILMFVALWMVFLYAPAAKGMDASQRIFYFHVPSAFVAFALVAVLCGSSITYLWTRQLKWDNLAVAATENSLLFATIVLITGPIWAKAAWEGRIGDWIFDPKIMTTLVLWLLLAGILTVRAAAANRDLAARLTAILGIVAAADVPIIHKATQWWRGHHPILFEPGKRDPLAPKMLQTFAFCTLVFFALAGLLLALRYRVASLEDRADVSSNRLDEA